MRNEGRCEGGLGLLELVDGAKEGVVAAASVVVVVVVVVKDNKI